VKQAGTCAVGRTILLHDSFHSAGHVTLPTRPRRCSARRLLAAGILMLALAGCATPQFKALLDGEASGLPQQAELQAVPFYAQEDYQCGPASLAMLLKAAGANATPEQLLSEVYIPQRQGSLQVEMLAAARRRGFIAIRLEPQFRDLIAEIAAGRPVLVLQNLGFSWYPVWHYAVVVGYDLERQRLVLRTGSDRRLEMDFGRFERSWAPGGYWAMLALAPGELPRTLSGAAYVAHVAQLERAGQVEAARRSYQAALERWPGQLGALIGLGNTLYAQGDLRAAESVFRQAAEAHPKSAASYNNLAQTLGELGRRDEALEAARIAVSLGGALLPVSRRTLDSMITGTGGQQ
jgi:tetratricopeptide (TPR) repeat protein